MLDSDPGLQEAKRFALSAQNDYYTAIVKWNTLVVPDLKNDALIQKETITPAEWNSLKLNQKNAFVTRMMLAQSLFGNYEPQDMTVKIDALLHSGEESMLKFKQVSEVVHVLTATGAIGSGDYLAVQSVLYADETVPMIPSLSLP